MSFASAVCFPPPTYELRRKNNEFSHLKLNNLSSSSLNVVAPPNGSGSSSRAKQENLCMRRKFMQKAFDFFMQIIQRLFKPELGRWWRVGGWKVLKFMLPRISPAGNKEVGIAANAFEVCRNKSEEESFSEQKLVIN